jgi:hypothetical protein
MDTQVLELGYSATGSWILKYIGLVIRYKSLDTLVQELR